MMLGDGVPDVHWATLCLNSRLGGARCSSVVRAFVMVRWVVVSILHGGPIDLFLVPASAPRLV